MNSASDLRQQVQSLSIPKDQRPRAQRAARGGGGFGMLVLGVLIAAALGGGGYFGWQRFGGQLALLPAAVGAAPDVLTHTVTLQRTPEPAPVLTASGKIVSDHRVEVSTKVSGQIVALLFEQGDRVEQGQVLARIEDVSYRARRDEAVANLARANANLEYQKVNYARIADLVERRLTSDIEYADARRWLDEAEAQVRGAQAALDWSAKALADCEVVAPIAGVILERNVEVGDFVAAEGGRGANANAQFGTIADMSKLRVEVDVSELDIGRIRAEMYCRITPDAYKDQRYDGEVLWIDPGANYAKATVQVKVRIRNPDRRLRIEGAAQVGFYAERPGAKPADDGLWIPAATCVLEASGNRGRVFVAQDGTWQERAIDVGRKRSDLLEVLQGLAAGDRIAASHLDKLKSGTAVRRP
ncbi:MAG: efflux RND transporter periplasmic adaptor subunit [Phycisphaerae bacterium]